MIKNALKYIEIMTIIRYSGQAQKYQHKREGCFDMFCPQCGKKLPDEAKFCLKCGKEIHQELLQEDNALTETNKDARNTYLSPESPVGAVKPLQCPRCGNKNCQPHYLQNVNGGGYNCLTGG